MRKQKNNLTWWAQKHNNYATREAVDILNIIYGFKKYDEVEVRCFQLGLLDGKPGLVWHFLQGGWYRFLVDAKIYEINHKISVKRSEGSAKKQSKEQKKAAIEKILKDEYGVELF